MHNSLQSPTVILLRDVGMAGYTLTGLGTLGMKDIQQGMRQPDM